MTGSSSDAVTVTASEALIIKQIECYFSDANLLSDTFLKEKIQEDDGWVTIDTILNFNRLKEITDDAQMICEALKKSPSGLLEISEQGDKIRRSPSKPLPGNTKKRRRKLITRTVCVKPFPLDAKLDDLIKFLECYGRVYKIWFIKRRFQNVFKRWVFATFSNKFEAAKFVNETETKFKEQALKVKFVNLYYYYHKAAQNKTKGKKDTEGKPHKKDEDRTNEEKKEAGQEPPANASESEMIITGPQGKRKQNGKYASSDGEDQDTEEPPAKVIRSEMFVKFNEVMKLHDAVSDGEEQDTKETPVKVIKSEMMITGPQSKRKRNRKNASSDEEEQETEEPPAKVIKSEMIIKFNEVMKLHDALSDGEDQDTKEPPAKVSKSEMIIKFTEVWKLHDASNDGAEQDTKEPPAKVSKSEMMITGPQGKGNNRKGAPSDREEQDTEEPQARSSIPR